MAGCGLEEGGAEGEWAATGQDVGGPETGGTACGRGFDPAHLRTPGVCVAQQQSG